MEVDAVVFDLDGTLFDHAGAARDGVAAWLRALGHVPTGDLLRRWCELEERHFAAWGRGELDWQDQRRARTREMLIHLGREPGDEAALDASFALYLENYERAWRAFGDVAVALEALAAAGMPVAVLTNGAQLQQHAKLVACGLPELTSRLFSADCIGFAKPDPRAYLHACDALELPPGQVLHVGDRYDLDVLGAQAAGLPALHLHRNRPAPPRAVDRIGSLNELPRRLGLAEPTD